MDRMTENKIVLIVRRTRLDDLISRFNTVSQAKFYIEHLGADFSDYLAEHQQYYKARVEAEAMLKTNGEKTSLSSQIFSGKCGRPFSWLHSRRSVNDVNRPEHDFVAPSQMK